MASSLEQLLQPGEQVLYHPKQSWLCNGSVQLMLAYVFSVAVLIAAEVVVFDLAGLVALASVVLSLVVTVAWGYPRRAPSEVMVTDRRFIQKCGFFDPRLIEIQAAEVKHVVAHEDLIRVTNRDGDAAVIHHPNTAFGIGAALAYAAGAPQPRLPSRLEVHLETLLLTCVTFTSIALGVVCLKWLFLAFGSTVFSFSFVLGAGAFFVGGFLANLAAIFLGGFLCLTLARPFLGFDELRLWLDHSQVLWADAGDEDDPYTLRNTYLWFAGWIYLRPHSDFERHG